MLKWLIMCGSTILIGAVVLVVRYDQINHTEGKGYDIKCAQSSEPSPTMNSLICTAEHSQQAKSSESSPPWWHVFFTWPEGITALLIMLTLVAIIWQAWETRKAAEAARDAVIEAKKSLDLSRDTAQRQLRAYVCVDSAFLKFPKPNIPEPQIYFINSGQTPAYNVRVWIHTWFAEYPPKEIFPVPPSDFVKGNNTLGPGTKTNIVAARKPVEPQFMQFLGTPQLTLYVYGEIHYKDTFGTDRVTKYRLIHGGPEGVRKITGRDGVAEKWILMPDIHGNEST